MWTVHRGVAGFLEILKTILLLGVRRGDLLVLELDFVMGGRFSLRAGVTSLLPRLSTRFLRKGVGWRTPLGRRLACCMVSDSQTECPVEECLDCSG